MAEFSDSMIDGLPKASSDTLAHGDPRILGWLTEAEDEGDRINRDDPNYDTFDTAMRYVAGDQRKRTDRGSPNYVPRVTINESRKAVQAHVATLTDLKPVFAYKTENPAFKFHAHILNQRTINWWVTTMADLALGDAVKYAVVGGTGDVGVEWDPHLGLGGDNVLIARDPRDTLPIRPGNQRNLQLWQGVTLREELPINVLRVKWPTKQHLFIKTSPDGVLTKLKGRLRSVVHQLQRPVGDTLSGLDDNVAANPRLPSGGVIVRRTYLMDLTRNMTTKPLTMGPPGTNWAYVVQPGDLLYPRKRLAVWTESGIIYDGPNPYWHGMYPLARLTLWDLPWLRLGVSIMNDTLELQDHINDTSQNIAIGLNKWMKPTVAFDRQAVSETFMKLYDPRKENTRVKLNAGFGEGFRHVDGPNPQVLALAADWWDRMIAKHNDLTSTSNLEALLQLRQVPGADTIQKFQEAMTPQIRQEARQLESFLRTPAEMVKVNWFQYETKSRWKGLIGDVGEVFGDFDFDPNTFIPALDKSQPEYVPELDTSLSHERRAQFFHKLFQFTISPNSIIALAAQEQKMLRFQLARQGYLDFWTLLDSLEIGNVGTPPPIPLPPLRLPDDPNEILANMAIPGVNPGGKYIMDPNSGQLLEIRVPQSITERLMAQALLGIGQTVNPAGRKAAGEQAPRTEMKDGGTRPVTTESSES